MPHTSHRLSLCALVIALASCSKGPDGQRLVTGKFIESTFLTSQNVGSLPVNMAATPDGRYVVTTDGGHRQSLWAIRTADGAGTSHVAFSNKGADKTIGLYYGLAIAPDNTVYAAQGNHDAIAVLKIDDAGKLRTTGSIKTRPTDFPAGLALDDAGRLYVANNDPTPKPIAFLTPSSVAIYDTRSGTEVGRYAFADSFGGTPNYPLAVAVLRDGSKAYVSSQRDGAVYVLDTTDPAKPRLAKTLSTGSHPIALRLDRAQRRLFVANAHSDTVSVVNVADDTVTATVLLRPDVARAMAGATPTGLALSPDERTLYASLGDMNAVAVVDVEKAELKGYVPAGWYPSSVAVTPDGRRLLVANAKGTTVLNPNPQTRPTTRGAKPSSRPVSPLTLLEGNVVTIAVPDASDLRDQTAKVLAYNRLLPRYVRADNPLAAIGRKAGKIKHVIYIVKENRTYDHVFGDLKQGNGDPHLCLFGRDVTPNQHALAERFVLMDNFYDCGEVSGDGWTWSTQAMANEYTQRNVAYQYSDRGRTFDYEGVNNQYPTGGFPALGPDGKPLADHPMFVGGAPAIPDVAEAPGGHIWDLARKHGLTYRNYGFFMSSVVKKDGKTLIPDNYPASAGLQPGGRDLGGITDIDFRRFDMDYPDSDAPRLLAELTKDEGFLWPKRAFGKYDAPSRFAEWHREFKLMLARDPSGGAVPDFMMIRFPTDHTAGMNPSKPAPRAMVADNDYAVGQLVEAVSRSPIWESTAIFIIEDDAQNGPDHVDAHRSTCLVISPWMKRAVIDHSFHNTASVLRTMELLMGLPPMCQYDAIATPIGNWDTAPNNREPYTATMPHPGILREMNPSLNKVAPVSPEARLMRESEQMDFVHADRAPADRLNQIIWKSVRGMGSDMPPQRAALPGILAPIKDGDDDDDDD